MSTPATIDGLDHAGSDFLIRLDMTGVDTPED